MHCGQATGSPDSPFQHFPAVVLVRQDICQPINCGSRCGTHLIGRPSHVGHRLPHPRRPCLRPAQLMSTVFGESLSVGFANLICRSHQACGLTRPLPPARAEDFAEVGAFSRTRHCLQYATSFARRHTLPESGTRTSHCALLLRTVVIPGSFETLSNRRYCYQKHFWQVTQTHHDGHGSRSLWEHTSTCRRAAINGSTGRAR